MEGCAIAAPPTPTPAPVASHTRAAVPGIVWGTEMAVWGWEIPRLPTGQGSWTGSPSTKASYSSSGPPRGLALQMFVG